ncbi:multidrug ABC transporter permease/ATP-binding protein [Candidatus Methylomicrobium oryzae]|uniref:multidrug ABC transporter permease/ATP-binding protein n=1 Tax=Candidatus Methylomicrobium oryzae TaxID=2802053 RepID=UPI0019240250|nr:multidrug ABC transporter permease/ATP-binding protein [Methylomicrobium sp. RS1]MBL1265180.1 multidrug ABC transporter permease/ATP-binding protein [Methylomicrobium sp. RS1]
MTLLRLLFNRFRWALLSVLALSIASAGLSVGVIAFTNERMLHPQNELGPTLALFGGLLAAVFVIGTASQICMTTLGHRLVYQLRRTLVKRILDTDLERLEQLGPPRLLASLNSDTSHLTSAFVSLPSTVYGLVLNLGGFAYLAWLSQPLFAATAAWMLLTVMAGWLLMRQTHARINAARAIEDLLYEDYQAALLGRKELALNRQRAERFYRDEFERHADASRDRETAADIFNGFNENWANAMILGSIGLVFFLAHGAGWADHAVATTYSLTILFLRTSLTGLIAAIPSLIGGSVALDKLNSLQLPEYRPDFSGLHHPLPPNRQTLALQEISYRYLETERGNRFSVGPLDFTLRTGEIVFLIGGNGSGKTTFTRLLTGLYAPQAGTLLWNGAPLAEPDRPAYRRLFSTVFSDFHLFHRLLGPDGGDAAPEQVAYWLEFLELTHKVKVEDSRLQDTRLSQGQRKRLALLVAILEDRPIIVLDEWAADQDPGYRRRFYTELLPLLKAQGKTVLAVTHDEHYFDVADRVVKMDEGHLLEIGSHCWRTESTCVSQLVQ